MKLQKAQKTVRQIKLDNSILKVGFGAVLFMNALLGFKVATRDEAVILVPPFQNESIEFINGRANREFYSQWAWSTAMMIRLCPKIPTSSPFTSLVPSSTR